MASRWLIVPTVTASGGRAPKYGDHSGVVGYSCEYLPIPGEGVERMVTNFTGEQAALDDIAAQSDVQANGAVNALNNAYGVTRSRSEWSELNHVSNP